MCGKSNPWILVSICTLTTSGWFPQPRVVVRRNRARKYFMIHLLAVVGSDLYCTFLRNLILRKTVSVHKPFGRVSFKNSSTRIQRSTVFTVNIAVVRFNITDFAVVVNYPVIWWFHSPPDPLTISTHIKT